MKHIVFGLIFVVGCTQVKGSSHDSSKKHECIILSDLTLQGSKDQMHSAHLLLLESLERFKTKLPMIRQNESYKYNALKIQWGSIEGDKGAQAQVLVFDGNQRNTELRLKQLDTALDYIKTRLQDTDPVAQKGSYYLSAIRQWASADRTIVLVGDLAIEEDQLHFETGHISKQCADLEKQLTEIFALKGTPKIFLKTAISSVVGSNTRRNEIEQCWRLTLEKLNALEKRTDCDDYTN